MRRIIFKSLLIFIILLIGIGNFLDTRSIGESFDFHAADGAFTFSVIPSKGRNIDMMELQFQEWKSENKITEDLLIYRSSQKNYLKFWKWYQFANNEYWDYPYQHK